MQMTLFEKSITSDDSTYLELRENPNLAEQRSCISKMYSAFEPYADANFMEEFPKHCLSRFWEMYLGSAILGAGCKLVPRKSRNSGGPDLCIELNSRLVWVEATLPNIGTGPDSDPLKIPLSTEIAQVVPEDEIILRFCSAIKDKHSQHLDHISKGLVHADEPFLVAVNGAGLGHLPHMIGDVPYAVRAVLPFGPYTMTFDPKTKKTLSEGFRYRVSIAKKSGSLVSTNMFLDPSFKLISGMFYSNINPFFCKSARLQDIPLLHNYSPSNPVIQGSLCPEAELYIEREGGYISVIRVKVTTA